MRTRLSSPRSVSFSTLVSLALALFITALFIAAVPASSQEDTPGLFGEVVDVRVVNLEAVVTDKKGTRVFDLQPSDFRLRVDGAPMPIDFFTEVQGGVAVAGLGTEVDTDSGAMPAFETGQTVGTSYLVFIDDYFAIASQRNIVLDNLIGSLANLRPEDRMAIVAFDGRNLDMLTSWSSAQPTLERTLRAARERFAYGLHRRSERLNGFGVFGNASRFSRNRESRLQLERVTEAVVSTLQGFAQPPGRKVALMLSGSWPAGSFIEQADSTLGTGNTDLTLTRSIAETANLLGYTLYPVDLAGIQTVRFDDDDLSFTSINVNTGGFAGNNSIDRQRRDGTRGLFSPDIDRQSTLRVLARDTGGRALLAGDRLAALPKVVQDTSSYYWLGFSPDRQRDDIRHRIELEVLRPGLKVRTRNSFLDLSRDAEVTMMAQSALLFGATNQLSALSVEIGETTRKGLSRMNVPVRLSIPVNEVTMVPSGGKYVAEVEVRLAAMDRYGSRSDVPVTPLRLTLDGAPDANGRLFYETTLKMRRQPHDLVISVHDTPSGQVLTSLVSVAP